MSKKIVVIFNPISGAGRASTGGRHVADRLSALGYEVATIPTQLESPSQWLNPALHGAALLLIAGGDGAVRMAAPSASRTGTPIYHLPFGTENLFAREFGMDASEATLRGALDRFEVRRVDMGIANGRTFLLMASVGFDAEVVHHLAERRGNSISHFSYVAPILSQLRRWRPPVLKIIVDGVSINPDGSGFVVVANSRQYGWRLNPAGRASMSDGLLDVAFFPTRSRRGLVGWAIRCRLQRHLDHARLIYRTGQNVTITCESPARYQIDGDPPGVLHEMAEGDPPRPEDQRPLSLNVSIRPAALSVLVP